MAKVDLSKYGITGTTEIVYNPSYEQLFEEETKPSLEGFEKGQVSELGAVDVMTGIYTGRSPKDKFIVMDENSKDTVWWTSDEYKNDNHPASQEAWAAVKAIAQKELSNKRLYVVDAFCGANKDTRMAIRFVMKLHGRHTLSPTCSSSPPLRNWRTLSLISLFTTHPRPRSRTTRSWA